MEQIETVSDKRQVAGLDKLIVSFDFYFLSALGPVPNIVCLCVRTFLQTSGPSRLDEESGLGLFYALCHMFYLK